MHVNFVSWFSNNDAVLSNQKEIGLLNQTLDLL